MPYHGTRELRRLGRWELALAILTGAVTLVLSTVLLGPWPDMFGEEARQMGQLRLYVEFFKPLAPPSLAIVATLGLILLLQRTARDVGRGGSH